MTGWGDEIELNTLGVYRDGRGVRKEKIWTRMPFGCRPDFIQLKAVHFNLPHLKILATYTLSVKKGVGHMYPTDFLPVVQKKDDSCLSRPGSILQSQAREATTL